MKKLLSEAMLPLVAFVAIIVVLAFSAFFKIAVIQTGSMEPVMPPGTIAIVQNTDDVKVGEIVTYQQDSMPTATTHRLLRINEDGSLQTRGDANSFEDAYQDGPLQKSDVIGKVVVTFPFFTAFYWTTYRALFSVIIVFITGIALIYFNRKEKKGLPSDTKQEETLAPTPV